MIRSDLECKTRTNLPINHCGEMLTLTLSSSVDFFYSFSTILFYILATLCYTIDTKLIGKTN
ncbi:hypothetical protein FH693_04730 [Streptococcus suis]|nr:hypothetical protein FH693_04730 [Streptococcus suis]